MEVISFHESDRQDHWLEEIKRSDWKSGAFLYELLSQGTFFDTVGENSKVLLLIDGDELISYCTYAQKDDIQPTELTPWMGFVYTFPEHRGHRYVELLFKEIERLAKEEQVLQVYISTNYSGLYEKYGCEFLTEMNDLDGNPSKVYVKKFDSTENDIKETEEQEAEEQEAEVDKTEVDENSEKKENIKKSGIKKVLSYLTTKKKRAILKRAFHIWQITPPKLAPLSESTHECASCGTEYQGNYCPRCGQSATVGRFSFKKALQHFLNVWGMGNRSMFRSLRDLMLRPGYMIRDYLSGMQSAYFPPFKMFFILLTFSLIIEQGIKLDVDATDPQPTGKQSEMVKQGKEEVKQEAKRVMDEQIEQEESPLYKNGFKFAKIMMVLWKKNPAIFAFLTLMLFSWPLYFFLRHSPNNPDLRFSEFIVATVYTSNSFSLFSMIGNILNFDILYLIAVFMIFVTLKQFSGYTKRRILGYMILTFAISFTAIAIVTLSGIGISYLLVSK
ncbi:MAG: GNAT family N-acetyltransferase [Muribaculaceae bacterium]|nr:GNAT family N-acetyltransferase [Muribaculaceae bacterium]